MKDFFSSIIGFAAIAFVLFCLFGGHKHRRARRLKHSKSPNSAQPIKMGYEDGKPFGFDNCTDVVKVSQFFATFQLGTPLKYLEMQGQTLDLKSAIPYIPPLYGVLMPILRTWKELGINLREAPESTCASDIGPIPENGGQYLEFLKEFRAIVESKTEPEQKRNAILSLGKDNDYFADILIKHDFQGDKINQWLGYDEVLGLPGFNPTLAKSLYDAGFKSAEMLINASNKDLMSIKGFGQARINQVRKLQFNIWRQNEKVPNN